MKSFLLFTVLSLSVTCSYSQDIDNSKYIPTFWDYPNKQQLVEYKWPYIYRMPKYIGITVGAQGFKSPFYKAGLAFNVVDMNYALGWQVGGNFLYARHFTEDIQSFNAEFGMYTSFCLALNFNYTTQHDAGTFGVKPMIGISMYHIQLLYGYNFFNKKTNQITGMRNNQFEIRYVIPLIKFDAKDELRESAPFVYPSNRYGERSGSYSYTYD